MMPEEKEKKLNNFIPPDQDQRLAAALPNGKNIIVEAGAGTGKTNLLTERICYLILGKGLKIDQIVALTFTDKAAAEIKLRVRNIMSMILKELTSGEIESQITKNLMEETCFSLTKQELEEIKKKKITKEEFKKEKYIQRIETSFELIERAQICTIHSFAFQILKTYPLQAGLAPHTEIDTGLIADNIFNKNWAVFLEKELSLNSPKRALWEKLLEEFTLEQLKSFARLLREPYFDYCSCESSPQEIRTFITEQIAIAKSLVKANLPEGQEKRKAEILLEQAIARLSDLLLNFSSANKEEAFKEEIEKPSKQDFRKGWEEENEIIFAQNFIDLANTVIPQKMDFLKQTYNLFRTFIQDIKAQMRKQNIVSYNQSIYFARDLIKENPEVRRELKKRYKSLMIDEFQDTDMAQGQLLLFLAEEENNFTKNWEDIILEPGKLFVVGDPKQSIYRFRGANISAYQKFLDLMINQQAQVCYLTTNFRSQGKIIDFVNKWGEIAIQEQTLIQPRYIKLQKGEKPDSQKVEFLQINAEEEIKLEDLRANEANIVSSWIQEHVGKAKLASGESLKYKDITILYPVSSGLKVYTEALNRYNIPYTLETSGSFFEAQEIFDIINLLKVIYDPQDKLALVGVLRSPLCSMKDEELIDLWQQKALNIFAKDFTSSAAVKNVYKLLKTFNAKAAHLTLKELISELFYKTDFVILETLASASEQALANLNKFLRIVFEQAAKGFTLGQLLLYIQSEDKETEKESQSSLVEENFDVVKVMTIHKAKGLSSPVVILVNTAYMDKKHQEEKYVDDLEGKLGFRLGTFKNLNYFILQEKEILHRKAQDERLLYVALTRAKEKLLICANTNKKDGRTEKSLKRSGCYPTAEVLEADLFKTISFEYKDPQSFLTQGKKIAEIKENINWADAVAFWKKHKTEFESYKKEEIIAPSHLKEDKTKTQAALDRGSLIHKALSNYFQTGSFALPLAMKILGLEGASLLASCREVLDNWEKSNILKELKTLEFLGSEIPFSMYENGVLVNGVIDALFRKKDGALFIVDFKTDKIDIEDLATYSLKYEQQLALYKRAVQKIFKKKEVCCALAYLSIDRLFEL